MDESKLRENIKELRKRKLSDEFIKKQFMIRGGNEKQLDRILSEPSNMMWAVIEKVAIFIINYFLWIFFASLILSSLIWALVDSSHFVRIFPFLVVVSLGSVVIGLVIKAGIYVIDSMNSTRNNQSFTKSFMLGFIFLVFIMLFGLPVDPFSWAVFITFTLIPVYIYFMVFYDLVQSEIFPLVLSMLVVSYILALTLPYMQFYLTEILADFLGFGVQVIDDKIYIIAQSNS